uniref:Uncharacterized protein n=1 Tax=Anguilla anguilla TaxID=7936 RepID=A0A0E9PP22_ANGAN
MYDFQNMSQLSIHYLYLLILVRVTGGPGDDPSVHWARGSYYKM